jgi:NifB/MoaA-like Fe-S oxidoreductase
MLMLIRSFPTPLNQLHDWQIGDSITHLDGRPIEDIIDLYYYTPEADTTTFTIKRKTGELVTVTMAPEDIDSVTGCFAPMEFKTCAAQCVFCFIDQNPKGMRDQIYVKDEDYRFSFLYGNYITLTSLGKRGLKRIIEQKMSPLFVSVHATDTDVRTRMLGIKKRMDVVAILSELADNGIEIHTQVVLCPGWNEGKVLEQTFFDLLELATPADTDLTEDGGVPGGFYSMDEEEDENSCGGVRSLAIVPVGLSAHREGLTKLEPVSDELAAATIKQVTAWQKIARQKLGYGMAYLSDEFYLQTGQPFPSTDQYDGFWQVDSAAGLTPRLRETWQESLEWRVEDNELPKLPLTVLTSHLATKAWRREFTPILEAAGAPAVEVIGIDNTFYGNTVTVAGLMTGGDLRRGLLALPQEPIRDVVLSPRVFNNDGLTLDGLTLEDLGADQPHRLHIGEEEGFVDFWAELS